MTRNGNGKPKRVICLAGGGPAAGLHIGVLEKLQEAEIEFDIWALSCIGAWVGVVYNQAKRDEEIEETKRFFRDVFRDDKSFKSFPTNTIFAPDWAGNAEAIWDFLLEPANYKNAFLPREIMKSFMHTMSAIRRTATRRRRRQYGDGEFEEFEEFEEFSEGDFNRWTLNHLLAVHPAVRFWTALLYKSKIDGLSRLHYPDSRFLKGISFERLSAEGKPYIFHNAWNLSQQRLRLFSNRNPDSSSKKKYARISAASLCACSALPYIEQTVEIDGDIYCEGALVDTVNFKSLLDDHYRPGQPLEIWVSRIIDANQILPPRNLHDSLANLCELFAATVGKDDVALFKYHISCDPKARQQYKDVTVVEIPVSINISFEWSRSNLELGIKNGGRAVERVLKQYDEQKKVKRGKDEEGPRFIEVKDTDEEKAQNSADRRRLARERLIAAGRVEP